MAKYCIKCGKALPEGVEICPDCNAAAAQEREAALFTHMSPDAEVWKTAEPVKQKPKRADKAQRNFWLYLAGALLVAAAVILIILGQPANRIARALGKGDIDRALEIYWSTPRLYESAERSRTIDDAIMAAAQKICDQYADHTMDAETASTRLAQLGTFGEASAEMLADTYAEFRSFSGSQSHMEEGDKQFANGDYLAAREAYLLVLQSDADYEAAQARAEECLLQYGDHIAEEAGKRMEQNDYPGALALLREGNETLSRDYGTFSESIDALLPVCYDQYEAYLLAEAKTLAELEDYEAAAAKIRGAAGDFPTEREALTAALAGYEDDARHKRMVSAGRRADEAYEAGNYVEAFEILEKFMTLPDEDVEGTKELLTALEQRFADDNCSEAEAAFDGQRENLADAIAILEWGLEQRDLEAIAEYRDHLTEYLPLNLAEAEYSGKEGVVFRNTGDFVALNGKTYSDGWVWGADGAELTFRPDGAYDLLECKFVTRRDDEAEAAGQFEVWCDGECVFTSEKLVHPQVDGQSVAVDITGCEELKLVFRCDYEVSTTENGYCYHGVCNPTLTKNIEETMAKGE